MCANREFRCAEMVPHKMVAFSALPEGYTLTNSVLVDIFKNKINNYTYKIINKNSLFVESCIDGKNLDFHNTLYCEK
jgi:hypothetical protein